MADEMDRAQDRAETHRMDSLTRRQMLRGTASQDVAPVGARICTECGDQIAPARLAAMPYTLRCAECAGRAELAARRAG